MAFLYQPPPPSYQQTFGWSSFDSTRLPRYKWLHLLRYHPYPRRAEHVKYYIRRSVSASVSFADFDFRIYYCIVSGQSQTSLTRSYA
jgi:hypothetical protein